MTRLPESTNSSKRLVILMAFIMFFATALAGCAADEGDEEAGGGEDVGAGDGGDVADGEDAGTTPETVELFITAHDDVEAGEFWFEVEELEGPNPEIALEAGSDVVIHFENVGETQHNLHFGGAINQQTEIIPPGEFTFLNFTVPEVDAEDDPAVVPFEGEGDEEDLYWCDPHFGQGMFGEFVIEEEGGIGETGG